MDREGIKFAVAAEREVTLYEEMDKVEHEVNKSGLRLGQFFCNQYITDIWPELFFADGKKARALIAEWMQRHHYTSMWKIPPSHSHRGR